MIKHTILFWLLLIIFIFLFYNLLNLIHTYFFPLWFANSNGYELILMFIVIISIIIVPVILSEKLSQY